MDKPTKSPNSGSSRLVVLLVFLLVVGSFAIFAIREDFRKFDAEAVEYVKAHYRYSVRFYSLSPDIASESWSAEGDHLGCLSKEYDCTNVHYSFNVMQGVEVKHIDCVWRVHRLGEKVVSAEPTNTEGRELFQVVQADSPQP